MSKINLDVLNKLNAQKKELKKLNDSLILKNKVITQLTSDLNFLKKRITTLHGREFLKDLLNCVENRQFDAKGFDDVSNKTENLIKDMLLRDKKQGIIND